MCIWALKGDNAEKLTNIGNATHSLSAVYETGKVTVEGKEDKINNIYDLEGNGQEWTALAWGKERRAFQGGCYLSIYQNPPIYRNVDQSIWPNTTNIYKLFYTSRSILYIK